MPREPLLLVIRSFGGMAAWAGEGSPLDEADESITHQVWLLSQCTHLMEAVLFQAGCPDRHLPPARFLQSVFSHTCCQPVGFSLTKAC